MRQLVVLVYCSDYRCSHSVAISADLGCRIMCACLHFVCQACGTRGDLRPDFNWAKKASRWFQNY